MSEPCPCGAELVGIEDGCLGLIEHRTRALGWRDVSGITALGGRVGPAPDHRPEPRPGDADGDHGPARQQRQRHTLICVAEGTASVGGGLTMLVATPSDAAAALVEAGVWGSMVTLEGGRIGRVANPAVRLCNGPARMRRLITRWTPRDRPPCHAP